MPISGPDFTSDYTFTAEDMEGDRDMTVGEDPVQEKGRSLIDLVKPVEWHLPSPVVYKEWEKDEEHEDGDIIDLCNFGDKEENGAEDSKEVNGEMKYDENDVEGTESEKEDLKVEQ